MKCNKSWVTDKEQSPDNIPNELVFGWKMNGDYNKDELIFDSERENFTYRIGRSNEND